MVLSRHQTMMRAGTLIKMITSGFAKDPSAFADKFAANARQAVGSTLREKLLGPTTGKPFVYGTYALAGASAAGVGMLCYYGLGMSKEMNVIDSSVMWPSYVRQRLNHTYAYLLSGLALTASAGIASVRSPKIMALVTRRSPGALFGSITLMLFSGQLTQEIPYDYPLVKHLSWASHCGVIGAIMAPFCMLGGPVLLRAAWYTAGIVGGLSTTAICAPSEKFLNMAAPLAMGLGVVFVSNIGTFFFPPSTALGASLASVAVYGGLVLFSALILYDTQRVIKMAVMAPPPGRGNVEGYGKEGQYWRTRTFDPINAQMSIYMSILNIFMRILLLLANGEGQRKTK